MVHSFDERRKKLKALAASEGVEAAAALLEAPALDSVSPDICVHCDYTTEVEPDQQEGYCEVCGRPSVQSALVVAGII